MNLLSLTVQPHASETLPHAFEILGAEKSFVVFGTTSQESESWTKSIQDAANLYRVKQGVSNSDISTEKTVQAAIWVPDSVGVTCCVCNSTFSGFLNRKHHCRQCGLVVCGDHSKSTKVLPHIHKSKAQRVCDKCFALPGVDKPVITPTKTTTQPEPHAVNTPASALPSLVATSASVVVSKSEKDVSAPLESRAPPSPSSSSSSTKESPPNKVISPTSKGNVSARYTQAIGDKKESAIPSAPSPKNIVANRVSTLNANVDSSTIDANQSAPTSKPQISSKVVTQNPSPSSALSPKPSPSPAITTGSIKNNPFLQQDKKRQSNVPETKSPAAKVPGKLVTRQYSDGVVGSKDSQAPPLPARPQSAQLKLVNPPQPAPSIPLTSPSIPSEPPPPAIPSIPPPIPSDPPPVIVDVPPHVPIDPPPMVVTSPPPVPANPPPMIPEQAPPVPSFPPPVFENPPPVLAPQVPQHPPPLPSKPPTSILSPPELEVSPSSSAPVAPPPPPPPPPPPKPKTLEFQAPTLPPPPPPPPPPPKKDSHVSMPRPYSGTLPPDNRLSVNRDTFSPSISYRPGMQNLLAAIQTGGSELRHVSITATESRRLNSGLQSGGGGLLSMLANVMADRRHAMTDGTGLETYESDESDWNDSDED